MDYGGSGSSGNGKLRQWLIEQVDCGKYPGLVWENEEKTIFRIPWKHAGKQDYNRDEDAALFKVTPAPETGLPREDTGLWVRFSCSCSTEMPTFTEFMCQMNKSIISKNLQPTFTHVHAFPYFITLKKFDTRLKRFL